LDVCDDRNALLAFDSINAEAVQMSQPGARFVEPAVEFPAEQDSRLHPGAVSCIFYSIYTCGIDAELRMNPSGMQCAAHTMRKPAAWQIWEQAHCVSPE
jgi:hypothetical protein